MFFLAKDVASIKPECECVSDAAAQHQVHSIDEEQFRNYELTELGLSAVHLKDWAGI